MAAQGQHLAAEGLHLASGSAFGFTGAAFGCTGAAYAPYCSILQYMLYMAAGWLATGTPEAETTCPGEGNGHVGGGRKLPIL